MIVDNNHQHLEPTKQSISKLISNDSRTQDIKSGGLPDLASILSSYSLSSSTEDDPFTWTPIGGGGGGGHKS